MQFKFDTKSNHIVVIPQSIKLDANLTVALGAELDRMIAEGRKNHIIDMEHCCEADITALTELADLQVNCYSKESSLVFTGLHPDIYRAMKEHDLAEMLNIAPTMEEAVDIVSMEILERDLLGEE